MTPIARDHPELVGELTKRATELGKAFEPRKAQGKEQRRLPVENVDSMQAAGLYRVYTPARYGGYELHMRDVLPMVAEIAHGCPASAWVLAIYQIHAWLVALMSEQTQEEVFADNPDARVCASLNPSKNSATKVDGGYLIAKGLFDFCSGCDTRDWAGLGVMIKDGKGAVVDVGCLLVPGADVSKHDDWFVSGLLATGSCSLIAEDVFVPEHRLLSYPKATAYQSPGSALNPATIYKTAFVPMLVLNLAGTALGIGERALSDFVETIKARGQSGGAYPLTGMKRIDSAAAHNVVAEATVQVEGARMILNRAGATIRECAAGEQMTREIGAKVSFQTSYAARQCMDAVRALFLQSGGGVLHPDHFMQQAFQDITAVNVHGFLSHEAHTTLYGAFALGHENPKAFL